MYWTQGVIVAACVLTAGGLGLGVAGQRTDGGSAPAAEPAARAAEPGQPPAKAEPPKAEEKIRTLPTIRDIVQTLGSALLGLAALAVLF